MSRQPNDMCASWIAVCGSLVASISRRLSVMVEKERALVMMSIRLPGEMHEKLRKLAFHGNVSIHSLLLEGVRQVLSKAEGIDIEGRIGRQHDTTKGTNGLDAAIPLDGN